MYFVGETVQVRMVEEVEYIMPVKLRAEDFALDGDIDWDVLEERVADCSDPLEGVVLERTIEILIKSPLMKHPSE